MAEEILNSPSGSSTPSGATPMPQTVDSAGNTSGRDPTAPDEELKKNVWYDEEGPWNPKPKPETCRYNHGTGSECDCKPDLAVEEWFKKHGEGNQPITLVDCRELVALARKK